MKITEEMQNEVRDHEDALEKKIAGNLYYSEVERKCQEYANLQCDLNEMIEDLVAWTMEREYDSRFLGEEEAEEVTSDDFKLRCQERQFEVIVKEVGRIFDVPSRGDFAGMVNEARRRYVAGHRDGSWERHLQRLQTTNHYVEMAVQPTRNGVARFLNAVGIQVRRDLGVDRLQMRYFVMVDNERHLDVQRNSAFGKQCKAGSDKGSVVWFTNDKGVVYGKAAVDEFGGWHTPKSRELRALHSWYKRDTYHNAGGSWTQNTIGFEVFSQMLNDIADEMKTNEFTLWLERLPDWDGVERVGSINMLRELYGYSNPNPEIERLAWEGLRRHMLGAIERGYEPGAPHDWMLVVIGEQGCGKSSLFSEMLPPFLRDDYYTEGGRWDLFLDTKKLREHTEGKVFVDFAESMGNKKDIVNAAKSGISRMIDEARMSYDKEVTSAPRTFVMSVTANLEDPAIPIGMKGTRRFITIWLPEIPKKLKDTKWVERHKWWNENREQVWAELLQNKEDGVTSKMPSDLAELQEEYNDDVARGEIWENMPALATEVMRVIKAGLPETMMQKARESTNKKRGKYIRKDREGVDDVMEEIRNKPGRYPDLARMQISIAKQEFRNELARSHQVTYDRNNQKYRFHIEGLDNLEMYAKTVWEGDLAEDEPIPDYDADVFSKYWLADGLGKRNGVPIDEDERDYLREHWEKHHGEIKKSGPPLDDKEWGEYQALANVMAGQMNGDWLTVQREMEYRELYNRAAVNGQD